MPAFETRRARGCQNRFARIHLRARLALLLAAAVILSSAAAAALAANGYANQSQDARAAAGSHCRPSDFAMQCIRFGPDSASTGIGSAGGQPTHAPRRHASNAAYGIDFGWRAVSARSARNMGAQFAASYLSTDRSKNWTLAMINAYHAMGLGTVCVWETSAKRALAGYGAGRSDALAALRQERALKLPPQLPVYFAVDFDETLRQAGPVASYFRGVNSVLGVNRTGGYGGYWTISRLFNASLIGFGWQTSAWSGGRWDPRAQLQQYAYHSAYDWDRATTSAYGASY